MKRAAAAVLLLVAASAGQQQPTFRAVDVYVDTGARKLAAYQLEITSRALVVGVEGGGDAAYRRPPYYDAAALKGGRIVLAAFTLKKDAPKGRVRVARVHFQETGAPEYTARAIAAAAPGGARIEMKVELVPLGEKR